MARDNFTAKTIEILAKRVGYICSNPSCRKHTVGPSTNPKQIILIGVAAHITAASPRGSRYDLNLSSPERCHINNGIWLCSNCSTLIDKDAIMYPVELLKEWKLKAEEEMLDSINGAVNIDNKKSPFIEADLIWTGHGRRFEGYSIKNKLLYKEPIPAGTDLICFYDLYWDFSFVLHNNSSIPVFNIKIESIGDENFDNIPELPKVNNIPPYQNLDFETRYTLNETFEGNHIEADGILDKRILELDGLKLLITYIDEERIKHKTLVSIVNGEVRNEKVE